MTHYSTGIHSGVRPGVNSRLSTLLNVLPYEREKLERLQASMHSNVRAAYDRGVLIAEAFGHEQVGNIHMLTGFLWLGERDETLPVQRVLRELGADYMVARTYVQVSKGLKGVPRNDGGMPVAGGGLMGTFIRALALSEDRHRASEYGVTIQSTDVAVAMTETMTEDELLEELFGVMGVNVDEIRRRFEP